MKASLLSLSLLALPCAALAADSPWNGTWNLDKAKSHFAGDTFSFSKAANGMVHYSDGGPIQFDFAIDGKEYPTAYNRTSTWTASGSNAWDSVTRADGKELGKAHRALSADGKTLTMTYTGTRPDGSAYHEEDVYTRISGSTTDGLIGKWRSIKIEENAPLTFVISTPAPGVLHYDLPQQKASTEGAADGSQHPVSGPDLPPGMTIGYKLTTPRELHYDIKVNGTPDTSGVQTLAADGRSFTDVSWTPGKEAEKQTAVYVKQ